MISIHNPSKISVLYATSGGQESARVMEWGRHGLTFHTSAIPQESVQISVGKQVFSPRGKVFVIEKNEQGCLVQFLFHSQFLNEAILISWLRQQNRDELKQMFNQLKISEYMPGFVYQELISILGRGGFEDDHWQKFVSKFQKLFHRDDFFINMTGEIGPGDYVINGFGGQKIGTVKGPKALHELEVLAGMFKLIGDRDCWQRFGVYSRREGDLPREHVMIGPGEEIKQLREKIPEAVEDFSNVLITGESGQGKSLLGRILIEEFKNKKARVDWLHCLKTDNDFLLERSKEECLQSFKNEEGLILVVEKAHFLKAEEIQGLLKAGEQAGMVKLILIGDSMEAYGKEFDFVFQIPDLSSRKEDIPWLVKFFLDQYSKNTLLPAFELDNAFYDWLQAQTWKGGVAELKQFVWQLVQTHGSKVYLTLEYWQGAKELPQELPKERVA